MLILFALIMMAVALPTVKFLPPYSTRVISIILLYAAALSFNAMYVQAIGSGLGIYSYLLQVTSVSQAIDVFTYKPLLLLCLLIVAVLSWLRISYGYRINSTTEIRPTLQYYLDMGHQITSPMLYPYMTTLPSQFIPPLWVLNYGKGQSKAYRKWLESQGLLAQFHNWQRLYLAIQERVWLSQRSHATNSPQGLSLLQKVMPLVRGYSTNAYLAYTNEVDKGQDSYNVNIIAKRFLTSGALPSAAIINQVLKLEGASMVTDSIVESFKLIKPVRGSVPLVQSTSTELFDMVSSQGHSTYGVGAYVWTLESSPDVQYVGSSGNVINRLRDHIRGKARTSFQTAQKLYGANNFLLDVYLLPNTGPESMTTDRVLALEQYLIFHLDPIINKNKVANANGVTSPDELLKRRLLLGKPVYVTYKGKHIHTYLSQRQISLLLGRAITYVAMMIRVGGGIGVYREHMTFSLTIDPNMPKELVSSEVVVGRYHDLEKVLTRKPSKTVRNGKPMEATNIATGKVVVLPYISAFNDYLQEHYNGKKFNIATITNAAKAERELFGYKLRLLPRTPQQYPDRK